MVQGASHVEVGGADASYPNYWPNSLFLGLDVRECGGWANLSTFLEMNPGSSSAQSRSGGRYVTLIYHVSRVSLSPLAPWSPPRKGGGVVALQTILGIFFFFFLESGFLILWLRSPITFSFPQWTLDTTGNNCKSCWGLG